MKPLSFLMSFLILALSCLPCADDSTSMNAEISKAAITSNDHSQDDEHEDACSPFCHCVCCASISYSHPVFLSITPAIPSSLKHFTVYHSKIAEVSIPIWQPPQLS